MNLGLKGNITPAFSPIYKDALFLWGVAAVAVSLTSWPNGKVTIDEETQNCGEHLSDASPRAHGR